MKKNEVTFIIGTCILMGVIWVLGELVMGLWIAVYDWAFIIWRILIVVATLIITVWHSFKYDEELKKYEDSEDYEESETDGNFKKNNRKY